MSEFKKRIIRMKSKLPKGVIDFDRITDPGKVATALLNPPKHVVDTRAYRLMHASDLHDVCVREMVLGNRMGKQKINIVNPAMQLVFEVGTAMHKILQNNPKFFGDRLIGKWKCARCGVESIVGKRPISCSHCKGKHFWYREPELLIPTCLQGHIDLLLEIMLGVIRIGDIKTIKTDEYKILRTFVKKNAYQLNAYFYLADNGKYPVRIDTSRGYLIYVPKEHPGKGQPPLKAFPVDKDPIMQEDIHDKCREFQDCYDVTHGRILKLPTPLRVCEVSNFQKYRAKTCTMRGLCKKSLNGNQLSE